MNKHNKANTETAEQYRQNTANWNQRTVRVGDQITVRGLTGGTLAGIAIVVDDTGLMLRAAAGSKAWDYSTGKLIDAGGEARPVVKTWMPAHCVEIINSLRVS